MRLTIAYVCFKFHKNRFYSKKVMAVSCPYVTMFVDFKNVRPLWAGSTGKEKAA